MKYFFIPFIIIILLAGCKKPDADYRDKFVGDYSFIVHYKNYILGYPTFDTTYTENGSINYGITDSTLNIHISNNLDFLLAVFEDGTIYENYYPHLFVTGEFDSKNTITFTWSGGVLGGGSSYEIKGYKI